MVSDNPKTALRELFGYEEFRPTQREVIDQVLDGEDLLAIMPTGSGKSLCYQLPACMMEGTALVVSPLIALMEDQLDGLRDHGIPATVVHSGLGRRERNGRVREMAEGAYDVVYVAPERFQSDRFAEAASSTDFSLLAVDEAHCISQWGHDFRPDYLQLGEARELLGGPTVLGLTATATRRVRQDIVEQLGVPEADIVIGGFERPNLHFEVYRAPGERAKIERLEEVLEPRPDASTVVYCATRRQVEDVADKLRGRSFVAGTYHAGLSDRRRRETQDAFMAGDLPVLVATNAFGMGVDKPDIRAIVHYNVTGSLEAYYQQAGRAGRDGEAAHCMLLYDPSDRDIHDFFIENSYPETTIIEAVWRVLSDEGLGEHEMSPEQIAEHVSRRAPGTNVHPWAVETSLEKLHEGGHLDFGWEGNRHRVTVRDQSRARDLRVDWERIQKQRKVANSQLEDVVTYAQGSSCRSAYLLHYFGTSPSFGDQCGRCDNCLGEPVRVLREASDRAEPTDPPETVVRKILSGVARTHAAGTEIEVAAMLRGSTSERVCRKNFDALSTHGILSDRSQHALVQALRECREAELVAGDEKLRLTEVGAEVMKGDEAMPETLVRAIEQIGF